MAQRPKRTREREELAAVRLLRLLRRTPVATMRTIEQKIADAGPFNQRIDPHILTRVRSRLIKSGHLNTFERSSGEHWTHRSDTPQGAIADRLAVLEPILEEMNHARLKTQVGQALEIAVFRALTSQTALTVFGGFHDLDEHDDSTPYRREEPPTIISGRRMRAPVDFVLQGVAGLALVEAKNIRPWIYPQHADVKELLTRALAVDAVPILIARRIHISTFMALRRCGLVIHETFNQRFPVAAASVVEKAKDKNLLGFHDLRLGNEPDERLLRFAQQNLPTVLSNARKVFDATKDVTALYVGNLIKYDEFTRRLRQRAAGEADRDDEH